MNERHSVATYNWESLRHYRKENIVNDDVVDNDNDDADEQLHT